MAVSDERIRGEVRRLLAPVDDLAEMSVRKVMRLLTETIGSDVGDKKAIVRDLHGHVCEHAYGHVYRHASKHVCRHVLRRTYR